VYVPNDRDSVPAEVKVNFSLCFNEYHAMKAYWGVEV
jgi:hypothetical protein